jgi:hypothetical protein
LKKFFSQNSLSSLSVSMPFSCVREFGPHAVDIAGIITDARSGGDNMERIQWDAGILSEI